MRLVISAVIFCVFATPLWGGSERTELENSFKLFKKMANIFLKADTAQRTVAEKVADEFKKPGLDKEKVGDLMYEYDCERFIIRADADRIISYGESVMQDFRLGYDNSLLRQEEYDKAVAFIRAVIRRAQAAKTYHPKAIETAQSYRN